MFWPWLFLALRTMHTLSQQTRKNQNIKGDRGRIVHHGPSAEVLADPARLSTLIVKV